MSHKLDYLICCIVIFLLQSCAIHAPMSEMVMFQEKKVDRKSYNAKAGYGGISVTGDLASEDFTQYLCNSDASDCNAGNEGSINVHSVIVTDSTNQYAVSVALGLPLVGIDASVNIIEDVYATGIFTADLQGQFIVQQRILAGNPIGWSLGLQISRENWGVQPCGNSLGCLESRNTTNVGIRSVLMATPILDYGKNRPYLYVTGSYNYDLASQFSYPKVGIAIGLY